MRSAPTTQQVISPRCMKKPAMLSEISVTGMSSFISSQAVRRAPCSQGRVSSATILTHCNAGGLATAGYGTALGVIRAAHEAGKKIQVFADETRPWLQGARLTAWELMKDGIPATLIADNMAGFFM